MIAAILRWILPESVRTILLGVGLVALAISKATHGTVAAVCEFIAYATGATALVATATAAARARGAAAAKAPEAPAPPAAEPPVTVQPGSDMGIGGSGDYDPTKMP